MATTTIKLADGKYTYVRDKRGQRVLRYNEEWRDLIGDGFVLAMAQQIEYLENMIEAEGLGTDYIKSCEVKP